MFKKKYYTFSEFKQLRTKEKEEIVADTLQNVITCVDDHKKLCTIAYGVTLCLICRPAYAAASVGGIRLIKLMQAGSFWLGLGVSIWGVIEAQLDYPGWKGRVAKGLLGYIAILLLPLVFIELRDTLQVDVWNQIDRANRLRGE